MTLENLPTNVLRTVRPNGKGGQGEERSGRNQGQLMSWKEGRQVRNKTEVADEVKEEGGRTNQRFLTATGAVQYLLIGT